MLDIIRKKYYMIDLLNQMNMDDMLFDLDGLAPLDTDTKKFIANRCLIIRCLTKQLNGEDKCTEEELMLTAEYEQEYDSLQSDEQ